MDLYKFGFDRAREMNEKSIEGLSGEEEALAIKTIEQEEDEETMESLMDDNSDEEDEPYEMYDDQGGYNN